MTFDEYWQEAQHHLNAEYHAALEIWKASRYSALQESAHACHNIAFDQRRSALASDGALMCKEAILRKLHDATHAILKVDEGVVS